jgi:hypothetical protein
MASEQDPALLNSPDISPKVLNLLKDFS